MKSWTGLTLLLVCVSTTAQIGSVPYEGAERLRISTERSRLEAAQAIDETACYKRFWVNDCLQEVKERSRDALADLRRQEIVLNDEVRKAKAAEQLQKIEDKSAIEKLQFEADQRAKAVRDFEERMARDKQKTADREALQSGEKANKDAATDRVNKSKEKARARIAKQAAEDEARKKYNERLKQSSDRRARSLKDKADQSKTPARPLPVPQ